VKATPAIETAWTMAERTWRGHRLGSETISADEGAAIVASEFRRGYRTNRISLAEAGGAT